MRLPPFEPSMAPALARCYNDLVAPMPYSRPVPEAWFADLSPSQWQRCTEEEILVAREGGEWAHRGGKGAGDASATL